jgi:hypothetical protein
MGAGGDGIDLAGFSRCRGRGSDLDIYTNLLLILSIGWADLRRRLVNPNGSLAENPLRSLLETAQSERSTGTLTLRNGNGQATSLYLLFGHLFHAQGEGKAGDDAVVNALRWTKGNFEFDPKAKLPADETVKAGIPELVQVAATTPPSPSAGAQTAATEQEPMPEAAPAETNSPFNHEPEPVAAPQVGTSQSRMLNPTRWWKLPSPGVA